MVSLIHSPLNYTGGKFKLLPQLLPLFPKKVHRFVDLFGGGFNVGINAKAERVVYLDINVHLVGIFKAFKEFDFKTVEGHMDEQVRRYKLTKENLEGFNALRTKYNRTHNALDLFLLLCFAFNNQIRFNNKQEFNSSFGKGRSSFNDKIRSNLKAFHHRIHARPTSFLCRPFDEDPKLQGVTPGDFVYADPPYLISTATYNDGKRGFEGWTLRHEKTLYRMLEALDARGVKWGMSNVTHHKGEKNRSLLAWSRRYNVHELKASYNNVSYQQKDRVTKSREVLITNY